MSFEREKRAFSRGGGLLRTGAALRAGIHPRTLYDMRDEGVVEAAQSRPLPSGRSAGAQQSRPRNRRAEDSRRSGVPHLCPRLPRDYHPDSA